MNRLSPALVSFVLAVSLVGAGCARPSASNTPAQTYSSDTYGYSFTAPAGTTVSAPQNYSVGPSASQQATWVYLGEGAAVSINVFLANNTSKYQLETIKGDASFKAIDVNGHEAWQSEDTSTPGYQVLTTVFFSTSNVFEIQYGGPILSKADRTSYDKVVQGFALTK